MRRVVPSFTSVALCGLTTVVTQSAASLNLDILPRVSYANNMLAGVMARKQGIVSSGAATSTLESGFLALALESTLELYPKLKPLYLPYLEQVLEAVSPSLGNETKDAQLPLDRFSVATAIYDNDPTHVNVSVAQTAAFIATNESLRLQPRNQDGGLWYYVYPNWSYLDGMFSLLPFMSLHGYRTSYMATDDMKHQIQLLTQHCAHPSGLLVHGYDFNRSAVWANKETGGSPYVWSRSLGWFLLGLVQAYERLDCAGSHHSFEGLPKFPVCDEIKNTTVTVMDNLLTYADKEHGAWWQLTTLGDMKGNFLESSGTALFTAALFKAVRVGILEGRKGMRYQKAALKALMYTLDNFVTNPMKEDGTTGYNMTVSVCSLNSTASYEYYTSRPIVENGLLGEAAFVMASLEMERLQGLKCRYQKGASVCGIV